MKEIESWKDIEGFKGRYSVSNLGRVRSNFRIKGPRNTIKTNTIILKQGISNSGYSRVNLHSDGKQRCYSVHRLVAKAFIPNPEAKPQTNHKNGIKTDNRLENLEWATRSENQRHRYNELGKKGGQMRMVIDLHTGIYYESVTELSNILGVKMKTLYRRMRYGQTYCQYKIIYDE